MGNSGSMHNLAAIDAHQYSHNVHHHMPPQQWAQSFPRPSQPQFKVLPDNVPGSRALRTTNNGTILQSGGTLTNRKDLPNGIQRSKSITPQQYPAHPNMNALRERSRTQLNMIEEREARANNYKRFGSEPDLRMSGDEENVANTKGKAKLMRNKKKKAAPQPPIQQMENEYDPARFGWRPKNQYLSQAPPQRPLEPPPRKLRLFKTKAESRKPSIDSKPRPLDQVDHHRRTLERKESAPETFRVIEQIPRETNHVRHVGRTASQQPPSMAQFRREKSFDVSLLSSKQNDIENYLRGRRQRAPSPTTERNPPPPPPPVKRYSEPEPPLIKAVIKTSTTSTDVVAPKNMRKIKEDAKDKSRKLSQPSHSSSGNSFQQELLEATKRRSISSEIKDGEETKEVIKKAARVSDKTAPVVANSSKPKEKEPSAKRIPEVVQPKPKETTVEEIVAVRKPSTTNNGPAPSKTFYFGMGDKVEHEINKDGGMDKTQMDVIDKFAEAIMKRKTIPKLNNESSESALSSDVDDGINENTHEEIIPVEGETEGISLQLRPILPKKLFEIPRFSPSAAWRLLSPDDDQKESAKWYHPEKLNLEPYSSRQLEELNGSEDRIERIYRDPIPGLPDNKSGDSGISGDAGLAAEREENLAKPDNEILTKKPTVGPFLSAWTPQQDLGEESSSDDADGMVAKNEVAKYNATRGHVFSLSLPREVHLASQLSEKSEKQSFTTNSLQKLKKTVSGAFSSNSIQDKNDNFRSDNWLLSRSQPNSIDNIGALSPMTENEDIVQTRRKPEDRQINSHQSRMSATIAPPSFSYLAGGKHMMYLPNHSVGESSDFNINNNGRREFLDNIMNGKENFEDHTNEEQENKKNRENLQDMPPMKIMDFPTKPLPKSKNHRFTFQSTVRQIERRKIADKLSKEAEEKEAQRLSELEAMRRVEEEFQKKRAREKASIRQQLRLFNMEENQCTSLPVEWSSNTRADPDGQVSSPKHSPVTEKSKIIIDTNLEFVKQDNDSYVDTKTPYISKLVEQKSSKKNIRNLDQPKSYKQPTTEVLSEFHQSRREYLEYRGHSNKRSDSPVISSTSSSRNSTNRNQSTEHPTIVCNIKGTRNLQSFDYNYGEHDLPIQADNYRKDFARGINSSDSEISGPSLNNDSNRIRVKQISRF